MGSFGYPPRLAVRWTPPLETARAAHASCSGCSASPACGDGRVRRFVGCVRCIRLRGGEDWLLSNGSELTDRDQIIVYDIRLPRVVLGLLVGAALAVSGAVMQGLFRNPLADPAIVGVCLRCQPRRGVDHRAWRDSAWRR